MVDANLLAAQASDVCGRTFNVACGQRISPNHLLDEIRGILQSDVEAVHLDPRPGDVKHSLADISQAREGLGYRPAVDFGEGLLRTVNHHRSKAESDPIGSPVLPRLRTSRTGAAIVAENDHRLINFIGQTAVNLQPDHGI